MTAKLDAGGERADGNHANAAATELPALTSLRGIAAVIVVLFHSSWYAYHFAGGAPPSVWRRGYLAVDLFFFLSGFVLTHVYARRLTEDRSCQAIGKFLWARFCRIYPASLFTTAIFVVQYASGRLAFPAHASFKAQLIGAVLLMQVPWLDDIVINSPVWSISAEWYAYLLFPFIVPTICRLRGRTATLLCVALLTAIFTDHMIFSHEQQNGGWGALARALPEFTVGVLAYRSYRERLFQKIWEKDITLIGIVAAIPAACVLGISDGPIVLLLVALLLASIWNSGRIAGLLNARPLRWLGEVSYAVYIFQILPFMVAVTLAGALVAHGFGGVRFELIAATFAIASGVVVHRCVDVPARAALRRLPARLMAFAAANRITKVRSTTAAPAIAPDRLAAAANFSETKSLAID